LGGGPVPIARGRPRGRGLTLLLLAVRGRTGLWEEIVEEAGVGTASSDDSRDDVDEGSRKEAVELSRSFDGIFDCEFVEGE